ncbi:MAG: hypothetical protein JXR76_14140 [Deltaproteobacteria bacterium]|nr:hypothetical protein [Deltaproteobacteria bacterium]
MSFFKWISGGSFADLRKEGDDLYKQENYGEARLVFQKALKKSKDANEKELQAVRERVADCSRQLANQRIESARTFFRSGDIEHAYELLDDALQISDSEEVHRVVQAYRAEFDAEVKKDEAESNPEMSEEELIAVIAGSWSAGMASEFAGFPESFYHAQIAAHEGKVPEAIERLKALSSEVDLSGAQYYYLELGRLQFEIDQLDDAEASLQRFLAQTEGDEEVEERWVAHHLLATMYAKNDNYKAAETEFMNAYRAAPNNHVPLLHFGVFLRDRGELERSKRTLENAMDMMVAMHPDMRVVRELGLTHLAMGARIEAMDFLKSVLDHCCQTVGHEQYDPDAAVPLAKLYEEDGRLRDASDIYRHLANGYDNENMFVYNTEAARLLKAQNADDKLVVEYLKSAEHFVQNDIQRNVLSQLVGMEK